MKQNALLRIYWMALGNIALLTLAGLISRLPPWSLSLRDVAYWAVVASLVAARALDILKYAGDTTKGTPATKAHLVRYAVGVVVAATGLWALVQSVAF